MPRKGKCVRRSCVNYARISLPLFWFTKVVHCYSSFSLERCIILSFFSCDVRKENNKITENLLPFFGICLNFTRKTVKKLSQRFGGYKTK